jgi:glycerate kinase
MDGGAGLLEVLERLPEPTAVLCDTRATLLEAPRAFGPQKGATEEQIAELERRFAALPNAGLPGGGAAGGLGAALASLGAELVPGAAYVLDAIGFRERAAAADLVVTGEGRVDATTFEGKAPGEAVRVCEELGVQCVLFEAGALSGDPSHAREDLEALAAELTR